MERHCHLEAQLSAGNHPPPPLAPPPILTPPIAVDQVGVGVGCVLNEVSAIEGLDVDITCEEATANSVAAPGELLLNLVSQGETCA